MAYAFDLLMRRQKLPIEIVSKVLAPPLWFEIKTMKPESELALRALRQTYGSLLMNGPFTIIVAHEGEMIGLTDRIKLRARAEKFVRAFGKEKDITLRVNVDPVTV